MKTMEDSEIKKIVNENKVLFGIREAEKAIKNKKAEKIIISEERSDLIKFKDKIIFQGNSKKLGYLCGKPFNISVVTVLKA
ncbi:MAG: ribosomal L7Ae/L30e/S12e/Gadd45 family protein [Candidatus Aenigmarchaeota archaeon]|nr:ribosomal L7Ae/L30e/S12e/Gadd45 family protein [Candidatus Aenigmarchaeota archaeon]